MIWRVRYPRVSRGVILLRNSVALRSYRVWSPLQATNEGGMSIRSVVGLWLGHGKKLVQDFLRKRRGATKLFGNIEEQVVPNPRCALPTAGASNQTATNRSLVRQLVRWCSTSAAAEFRRNAGKRLAYGGRSVVPYLGFVGVNLISGHGMVTKKDELERLCEDIRCCAVAEKSECPSTTMTLDDLQIGEPIAKGCNAIVHAACWKQSEDDSVEASDDITDVSTDLNPLIPTFKNDKLAVKMMFNYDAESNTFAILRAMHRETIPACSVHGLENISGMEEILSKRPLPAHPNIVKMQCAFTDRTPFLPEAMQLYPDALPYRLNINGSGRNMTLFLVMKRYHCNLRDYLNYHNPPPTTRLLLLTQLLEAVTHLTSNGVVHRDLKSDNVLLDLSTGLDSPIVAISDFGNAYLGGTNLRMPFTSADIERGGNYALMAPEVKSASPGLFSFIDYSRSDLWTLGTLAYEIFGKENPFYSPSVRATLECEDYSSEDLPPFPEMPNPLKRLVADMLQKESQNRPSPAIAADVCHFLLWGPRELISTSKLSSLSRKTLIEWLVTEAAISLLEGTSSSSDVLSMLRNTFLRRLHIREVEVALGYFQ